MFVLSSYGERFLKFSVEDDVFDEYVFDCNILVSGNVFNDFVNRLGDFFMMFNDVLENVSIDNVM